MYTDKNHVGVHFMVFTESTLQELLQLEYNLIDSVPVSHYKQFNFS